MSFTVGILCASVLLVQGLSAQIISAGCNGLASNGINLNGNGIGLSGLGLGLNNGLSNNGLSNLNNGGGFVVTSSSPIAPTGISVLADNLLIEGPLTVGGSLPVLATVALEGQLETTGQASTSYSCGNGNVGITSQTGASGSNYGAAGSNYGAAGSNYGAAGSNYGASGSNYGASLAYGGSGIGYSAGLANSRVY